MIKRLILFPLILVVLAYVGAELLAAGFAEKRMADYIVAREPLIREPRVRVGKPLLLGLLVDDTISRVEVSTDRLALGPVTVERVQVVLNGTHIDRGASIRRQSVVVSSIDSAEVSVDISEEEASKLLPSGFRFNFDSDGVTLTGPGFRVKGLLEATGRGALKFRTSGSLPVAVSVPLLRFPRLPLVGCIPEVQTTPGTLKLSCTQTDPPFPRRAP